MFKLKPAASTESDTNDLVVLYQHYERRILWPLNDIESTIHESLCVCLTPWCKCRTRQEEIHEWEDWASMNFGKNESEINWASPADVLGRINAKKNTGARSNEHRENVTAEPV